MFPLRSSKNDNRSSACVGVSVVLRREDQPVSVVVADPGLSPVEKLADKRVRGFFILLRICLISEDFQRLSVQLYPLLRDLSGRTVCVFRPCWDVGIIRIAGHLLVSFQILKT